MIRKEIKGNKNEQGKKNPTRARAPHYSYDYYYYYTRTTGVEVALPDFLFFRSRRPNFVSLTERLSFVHKTLFRRVAEPKGK